MASRIPHVEHIFDTVAWRRGDLAYYFPAFSGPVPCRVVGRIGYATAVVQLTASRPGYSRGEYCTADLADGRADKLYARNSVGTDRGRYYANSHHHDLSGLPEYIWTMSGLRECTTTDY